MSGDSGGFLVIANGDSGSFWQFVNGDSSCFRAIANGDLRAAICVAVGCKSSSQGTLRTYQLVSRSRETNVIH